MNGLKGVQETAMKIVIKVGDVVELVRRFEESPALAMQETVAQLRDGFRQTLERIMETEVEIFLGRPEQGSNKRNGYTTRAFAIKGLGSLQLRVPRDRAGKFITQVVPSHRRYDEAIEKDLALMNLAGLSTRVLSQLSSRLLGVRVSAQEVSNAMHTMIPAAKEFLNRPLEGRRFVYLYVDGTNFRVRRSTVEIEPTLVVLGVDENGRKSVLSMVQGNKDNRAAWQSVFDELKKRGLDSEAVQLGIMDGLPGLQSAFVEAFPRSKTGRCWVHKARNVMTRVPRRYQAAFQSDWDKVAYAQSLAEATTAFVALKQRWSKDASDAIECMERDIEALLEHYKFPNEHWDALRTTNPIERVNKEFKRRSKSMEVVSADGLKVLLAFTALRLEYGWALNPITSNSIKQLKKGRKSHDEDQLKEVSKSLFN
jgi:transposase-like protein